MMATAGFFRLIPDLPVIFWKYPVSYMNYMAWALQVRKQSRTQKCDLTMLARNYMYIYTCCRVRTKTT